MSEPQVMKVPPFAAGQITGGCLVQHLVHLGATTRETTYWVRLLCCEHEREMSHRHLVMRTTQGATLCLRCAGARGARAVHARATPKSPKPPKEPPYKLIAELPRAKRPTPRITDADIERHLARVFGK